MAPARVQAEVTSDVLAGSALAIIKADPEVAALPYTLNDGELSVDGAPRHFRTGELTGVKASTSTRGLPRPTSRETAGGIRPCARVRRVH